MSGRDRDADHRPDAPYRRIHDRSRGPRERGKGVGTDATPARAQDYAFHVTNLRSVYLTVIEPNEGAIKAYECAGFKRQGLRRNSSQWLGETVNEVLMDAIPEDFKGRHWSSDSSSPGGDAVVRLLAVAWNGFDGCRRNRVQPRKARLSYGLGRRHASPSGW